MENPTIIQDGLSKEEKNWAMFSHLSALLGFIGIPLANIIAPLVMWQIKKDTMPFGSEQAKEALNFQISMTIYGLIAAALCLILIGFVLLPIIFVAAIVLTILAGIKAGDGHAYRYPMTMRLVK